jgi:FtsH-binding integral membrane protein
MVAALIGVVTFCAGVLMVVVTFRAYGAQDSLWAAVWLGAPLVGGVTAALRPRNAVGWLLLGVGIFGVGSQISYAYSPGRHLTDQAALKAMSRAEMLGHG